MVSGQYSKAAEAEAARPLGMSFQLQSLDQATYKTSSGLRDWEIESFSERKELPRHPAKDLGTPDEKKPGPYYVICHSCMDGFEFQETNLGGR